MVTAAAKSCRSHCSASLFSTGHERFPRFAAGVNIRVAVNQLKDTSEIVLWLSLIHCASTIAASRFSLARHLRGGRHGPSLFGSLSDRLGCEAGRLRQHCRQWVQGGGVAFMFHAASLQDDVFSSTDDWSYAHRLQNAWTCVGHES
jgi:hypothetical protein